MLPISDKFNEYAKQVQHDLEMKGVRTSIDDRSEKIGRKIRDNEMKHIPYLIIVGEKEANEGLISVRKQGEGDKGSTTVEAFADEINRIVDEMTRDF